MSTFLRLKRINNISNKYIFILVSKVMHILWYLITSEIPVNDRGWITINTKPLLSHLLYRRHIKGSFIIRNEILFRLMGTFFNVSINFSYINRRKFPRWCSILSGIIPNGSYTRHHGKILMQKLKNNLCIPLLSSYLYSQ